MITYLWLLLAFSLNAMANLFVKHSNSFSHLGFFDTWLPTAYTRTIAYAIICLALSFIFFTLAARALPISVVYSIHVSMSLVLVTFFAWFLLGERLTPLQYLGIFILMVGMTLIMTNEAKQDLNKAVEKTELRS